MTEEQKEIWQREQDRLKEELILLDQLDFMVHGSEIYGLYYVGGVDISFAKNNDEDACASLVILSFPDLKVVYEEYKMIKLSLPFISGFLAFREVPFLQEIIEKLRKTNPSILPQVILVDGNGILHPRGFGSACHLGVLTKIPTIGVGKTLYLLEDGMNEKEIRNQVKSTCKAKEYVHIIGPKSGKIFGAALRTTEESRRPLYISPGHKVCLDTAITVVLACSKHKNPEPVRLADLGSREEIRKWEKKGES